MASSFPHPSTKPLHTAEGGNDRYYEYDVRSQSIPGAFVELTDEPRATHGEAAWPLNTSEQSVELQELQPAVVQRTEETLVRSKFGLPGSVSQHGIIDTSNSFKIDKRRSLVTFADLDRLPNPFLDQTPLSPKLAAKSNMRCSTPSQTAKPGTGNNTMLASLTQDTIASRTLDDPFNNMTTTAVDDDLSSDKHHLISTEQIAAPAPQLKESVQGPIPRSRGIHNAFNSQPRKEHFRLSAGHGLDPPPVAPRPLHVPIIRDFAFMSGAVQSTSGVQSTRRGSRMLIHELPTGLTSRIYETASYTMTDHHNGGLTNTQVQMASPDNLPNASVTAILKTNGGRPSYPVASTQQPTADVSNTPAVCSPRSIKQFVTKSKTWRVWFLAGNFGLCIAALAGVVTFSILLLENGASKSMENWCVAAIITAALYASASTFVLVRELNGMLGKTVYRSHEVVDLEGRIPSGLASDREGGAVRGGGHGSTGREAMNRDSSANTNRQPTHIMTTNFERRAAVSEEWKWLYMD